MRYVLLAVGALVLLTNPARAVDKQAINEAIDRGVEALKALQRKDGTWPHERIGATALAGLTLLECGVPKSDRSIQDAAKAVRAGSMRLTHTYSLACSVLFLDRLDEALDTPLIESMVVRLLAGQKPSGAWFYDCPSPSEGEVRRLSTEMDGSRVLKGSRDLSKLPAKGKRTTADLPREIQAQLKVVAAFKAADTGLAADNSNTQFANLGLWIGRRYGVPTRTALLAIDKHYRTTQAATGEWGYPSGVTLLMPGTSHRETMTCAGLLGLATGHGIQVDVKRARAKDDRVTADISKDTHMNAGLKVLAGFIGDPLGWKGTGPAPVAIAGLKDRACYFLWSVERIAVMLSLDTIGKKDWYNWGAELLLANQRGGLWTGGYCGDTADTCFALMFLKKVNLVHDLTGRLAGAKDPGNRFLSSGGVGGGALLGSKALEKNLAEVGIGNKPSDKGNGPATGAPRVEAKTPRTAEEVAASKLVRDLKRSRGETRSAILKKLRDGKGAAFTEALAAAIPELDAEARQLAREALTDRLTRMKPATLRGYFKDRDTEVRRAAALAAGQRDARSLVPDLIGLLDDDNPMVRRAAQAALKEMAGKNFGPKAGADSTERKKAIEAWQAWWKKQARK
jgi:hypothetical protein